MWSGKLGIVEGVIKKSIAAESLEAVAGFFEEIDPGWFMDIEHVERLYMLISYMHDELIRGSLDAVRVGNYIVIMPDPSSPDTDKYLARAEHLIIDALRSMEPSYEDAELLEDYYPLASLLDPSSGEILHGIVSPAGMLKFYTAIRNDDIILDSVPETLAGLPAAVVGVDSDTGKLFVHTLPHGTGLAALIVEKELREGSVDAVKAVLGYDYELDEKRSDTFIGVVRLQGDLYVRVNTYTRDPRGLARRLAAVWSAAQYALDGMEDLASRIRAAYLKTLENLGVYEGFHVKLRAAAIALETSIFKDYQWMIDGVDCVYTADCEEVHPTAVDVSEEGQLVVEVFMLSDVPRRNINTKPHLYETLDLTESLVGSRVVVAAYRPEKPLEIKSRDPSSIAMAAISNPAWAATTLLATNMLSRDHYEWQDVNPRLLQEMRRFTVKALIPRPLRDTRDIDRLPVIIAYAAAVKALQGGNAPQTVISAVEEAGKASIIEAEVGDHKVAMEGYLLEWPARDGVIMGEILADMLLLNASLYSYMEEKRPIKALIESKNSDARDDRLAAARALTRLFAAKESLLAAVTAGKPGEVEARHPEHGAAAMEIPGPALVTVTSNPAVIYPLSSIIEEDVPSYLRSRLLPS